MKSDKLDKYKEPEVVRKERIRLSKTTSTKVIPNKKKNIKPEIKDIDADS